MPRDNPVRRVVDRVRSTLRGGQPAEPAAAEIRVHFDTSLELREYVAARSNGTCILSFSGGKDSIVAWLAMREQFDKIVPIFMYLVPGLRFVEEGIAYFEEYFDTHIIRMPHPSLYRLLMNAVFMPPERLRVLEARQWEEFTYDDVFNIVKLAKGLPLDTWTAIGVRSADSLNRRTAIKRYGSLNIERRTFYPVFDWNKDTLVETLKDAEVMLPVDYHLFGRSFDGIDYRFLQPLKEKYPDDYATILEWYPLAELEMKRIEFRKEYYAHNPRTTAAAR